MKFVSTLALAAVLAQQGQALLAGQRVPSPDSSAVLSAARAFRCNISDAPAVYDFMIGSSGAEPAEASKEDKRTELKEAIAEYRVQAAKFQTSEGRLRSAMEALLEVPSVDGPALTKLMSAKKNSLVVFYAPWCGHCQKFVLSDGSGDPSKAPLEIFRDQLATSENEALKSTGVVRFDVQAHGDTFPTAFHVEGIPTVYFVDKAGTATQYAADPHDVAGLKEFIKTHAK